MNSSIQSQDEKKPLWTSGLFRMRISSAVTDRYCDCTSRIGVTMKVYKVNKNISRPTFLPEQTSLSEQIPTAKFIPNFCDSKSLDSVSKSLDFSSDSPLGKTAKSAAPPYAEKLVENRRNRFKYQSVAARILTEDAAQKLKNSEPDSSKRKKYVGDIHRTCDCAWTVISSHVSVKKSRVFSTAHYKGLATCGSVWACPLCTAKIQERRRIEIAHAMSQHYKSAGQTAMITLTAPHYSNQSLADLRNMQQFALRDFRKGSGSFTRLLKENGYLGLIRSLEVTVSESNGWHLHTHELWFLDRDADIEKIKSRLLVRWESSCIKAGLLDASNLKQIQAFRKHSVDVKAAVSCSEYLAKMDDSKHWGADREIAKSSTKKGRKKGFHPFGLLAEISEESDNATWCKMRFIEYCNVMKGSRQLFWSAGLKAQFLVDEKTDEEIALESENELIDIVNISVSTWNVIRKSGARATVLELAELEDKTALKIYLTTQQKIQLE